MKLFANCLVRDRLELAANFSDQDRDLQLIEHCITEAVDEAQAPRMRVGGAGQQFLGSIPRVAELGTDIAIFGLHTYVDTHEVLHGRRALAQGSYTRLARQRN